MDSHTTWTHTQHGLSPPIMSDLFTTMEKIYNLRNFRELYFEKKKTIRYGTQTVTYRAAQLWDYYCMILKTPQH